jgi:hypothetical protein
MQPRPMFLAVAVGAAEASSFASACVTSATACVATAPPLSTTEGPRDPKKSVWMDPSQILLLQISSTNISFDAESAGDARGTLCFGRWAVLGRKTGVRRAVTYPTYVRVLSREGFFENFRFRPTTSHSTRNPLAMSATPSVSAADHFLRESGRPRPLARQESASVNFIMGRPTFSSPQPESTADSLPRPNPRILSSNFSSDWRIW